MRRIAIHSVPRSGSTWLGEIFNSNEQVIYKYQPLFSYALKDRLSSNSTIEEIQLFFKDLKVTEDDFLDQKYQRESLNSPYFEKSELQTTLVYKEVRYHHILKNLLEKDESILVVGLIRNPLAVINSWLKAPREFRKDLGWNELEEWGFAKKKNSNRPEEFYGFEKWIEVANLFSSLKEKYPDRFYLIDYKRLNQDSVTEIETLFQFCGLEVTNQTRKFIKESKSFTKENTYAVFKESKIDSDWIEELNLDIRNQIIQRLVDTPLNKYLEY